MNICFVPLRGGSKSIPMKNIKPIAGKPLCNWVIEAALNSKEVDLVVAATDSEKIKKYLREIKDERLSIYNRSAENSTDTASTESVMLEYIRQSEHNEDDNFMLLQATSPLTTTEDVEKALELVKKHDSVLSVVENKNFFWNKNGKPVNYDPINRPRRQDFEGFFQENGALYVSKIKSIIESECRISGDIGLLQMVEETAYEIDEPSDWIIVEGLIQNRLN